MIKQLIFERQLCSGFTNKQPSNERVKGARQGSSLDTSRGDLGEQALEEAPSRLIPSVQVVEWRETDN